MSSTRDTHSPESARLRSHVPLLVPCRSRPPLQPALAVQASTVALRSHISNAGLHLLASEIVFYAYACVCSLWQS